MKRPIKYFAALLTALFILSLLSCQSIKLNSIEKQETKEPEVVVETYEETVVIETEPEKTEEQIEQERQQKIKDYFLGACPRIENN